MRDYPTSRAFYDEAVIIPGRSLTRSKAPGRFFATDAGPSFAVRGRGAILTDVDGHEFIDTLCGLGAISLGYGVTSNGSGAALGGGVYSLPHPLEFRAAGVMLDHVAPWATRCRFTKTGSESTHAAYRIAKRATGRHIILMGQDSYHGWFEWCSKRLDGQPEDAFTVFYPPDVYLPTWIVDQEIAPSDIAAVFVEPHRWQPTLQEWFAHVRQFCTATGALFVLDEMIYGGRWALGGASAFFGVHPDMACYGKALGNGAAIACVVGNEALLDEHGQMVSGTYSGDTVGLEALIEVVNFYTRFPVLARLWARGEQLAAGLRQVCRQYPALGAVAEGAGAVHQRMRFPDPATGKLFSAQMAERGVLHHPDCVNVNWSMTPAMIDTVITAAGDSMAALEAEVQ